MQIYDSTLFFYTFKSKVFRMKLWEALENTLSDLMGNRLIVLQTSSLQGGDINETYRVETNMGAYCLKVNFQNQALENFEAESRGLTLLSKSNFILPKPLHTGLVGKWAFLLMDFISTGKAKAAYWEIFGIQLAAMHKISNTAFGLGTDNFIGLLPQSNRNHPDWASFYANERIYPLLLKAVETGLISEKYLLSKTHWAAFFEVIFPVEPPALLHGDLWAGNKMISENGLPVLIDPAVYFGHREMDLAMMRLFSGFDQKVFGAYHEAYPLKAGWEDRVKWCQLYPLLVHALLFGGSYAAQTENILNEVLRKF